uniref:IQ domain-containing protein E n=1 Tax=Takifugu rubripes TaxID=31033 RepID=H2UME7_TAKRU
MSVSTAKLSLEVSDVQTDEDCDELVDDGFCFSADVSDKIRDQRTKWKRSSGKPPPPRSPYCSSLNRKPRRVAVAAWRLPRSSLGDSRGATPGESSLTRLTFPSNGHKPSQTLRSEYNATPELFKQTSSLRKPKNHSGSNGVALSADDYREKEDMYDEIIRLKKSLQAHKSDNQQLKVKLRRLEEDNAKREKQIEELLDPTKGSEYTRSLVDKKKDGSVVVNGLKQRILKLEQQCREKENALSKLQSELRTTSLDELKITVETYFEEIQRLRILLEAAEKNSRAESRCSQRQQKVLNSALHRLSENLKELQQENSILREELNTESPAGGLKGYREWSKQRLLRKLLEVETRLEDSRRHTHTAKRRGQLEQGVQTMPTEMQGFTMATEAVFSVGTMTEEEEEISGLKDLLSQLEKMRAELQQTLSHKDDELRRLRTEKEDLHKETERWKAEQIKERDEERQQHKMELEQLMAQIQTLEERIEPAQAELSSDLAASPKNDDITQAGTGLEEREEKDVGGTEEEGVGEGLHAEWSKREGASVVIQRNWREHRERDMAMLQSAFRGHLSREALLKHLLEDLQNKSISFSFVPFSLFPPLQAVEATKGQLDGVTLTLIQSAFRGHLARCTPEMKSFGSSVPPLMGNASPVQRGAQSVHHADRTDQMELRTTAESSGAAALDSDDSDDIIVSPSRPLRSREVLML